MQNKQKNKQIYLIVGIFVLIGLILTGGGNGETEESESELDISTMGLYEYEIRYGAEVVAANAPYFSLSSIDDVLSTVWQFPVYLWHMIFGPTEEQMQVFLRDGFAFGSSGTVEVAERISMRDDAAEIYMLTWQPAESNVRRSQLVHEQEETEAIPAATYINSNVPLVYIYNSHPAEMIGGTMADLSVGEMNVIELSHMLAIILEEHGIPSLVEDRNVNEVLRANNWVFGQSYQVSRIFIEERIHQYPTLEFFFDLHRDGIPYELARIDIDDRPYARILFVIGVDNPVGYSENYAMARQLHNMLEERRPGISRGVSVQGGHLKNGVYNQDVASTLQLIEIGTVETTPEEAMNTMAILAEVLAEYMLGRMGE